MPNPRLTSLRMLGKDVRGDNRHQQGAEREPAPLGGSGIRKLLVSLERSEDPPELPVVAD